jgi:hypothetical protein
MTYRRTPRVPPNAGSGAIIDGLGIGALSLGHIRRFGAGSCAARRLGRSFGTTSTVTNFHCLLLHYKDV